MSVGSLVFGAATSDRVDSGNASDINDLAAFTYLAWVYPTTFTTNRAIAFKGSAVGKFKAMGLSGVGGDMAAQVGRATVNAFVVTNDAPLALNTWGCVALSYGAVNGCKLYHGSLTTLAVQSSYSATAIGSGATSADAASTMLWGNNDLAGSAFQGRIAMSAVVGVEMTLADIQSWQVLPRKSIAANVALRSLRFGKNAADAIEYGSGGSNGTVTGATQGDGPPVGSMHFHNGLWRMAA